MVFLSNVLTALTQVFILFLVAAVGFLCHKIGIYTEKASRLTTDLLFYIVTPAVIIRSFASIEYNRNALKGLLLAFAGGVVFHTVGIIFSTVLFNKGDTDTACIFKFASTFGNVGYMALPMAQAVLGAQGVFYCSVILVPFNILSFTYGSAVMNKGKEKGKQSLTQILKKILVNPGVIGVVIGLPLFIAGIHIPNVIYQPVSYLADLNTPLAMIMFGTYLACADWKTVFSDKRIFTAALVKIILMPIITIGLLKVIGFTGVLLTACVLSASAPTANNTIMFSAKYGRDTTLASKTTAFVSVAAIITMPLMIAIAQSL